MVIVFSFIFEPEGRVVGMFCILENPSWKLSIWSFVEFINYDLFSSLSFSPFITSPYSRFTFSMRR